MLEHSAVPRVFVDHQLRTGDTSCHVGAVHGRDHDIVVAVCDQDRNANAAEVLGCLTTPGLNCLELSQESSGSWPFVASRLAFLQPVQEGLCGLVAIGRCCEKQAELRVMQCQ